MKKITLALFVIGMVLVWSCEKDDKISATNPPNIVFNSDENAFQDDSLVHAAPGKQFTVVASLTDDVGIESFTIAKPEWFLDNTVNVADYYRETTLNDYQLMYQFIVPEEVDIEGVYEVQLSAKNLGGLSTKSKFYITMDGDYEAPVISDVNPSNNAVVQANGLSIKFKITENNELKYVLFEFPQENIKDSTTSFRGGKVYSYDELYEHLKPGNYKFKITAVDKFENSKIKEIAFSVIE